MTVPLDSLFLALSGFQELLTWLHDSNHPAAFARQQIVNFHSAQHHSVTTVASNHKSMINATQGSSRNAGQDQTKSQLSGWQNFTGKKFL